MPGEEEGLETKVNDKPYNPAAIKTDFEKRLIEKAAGKAEEGEEEGNADDGKGEEDAESTRKKVEAENAKKVESERREKMRKDLEDAMKPEDEYAPVDESQMTDREKALQKKLKEEMRRNALRDESDLLVKLLQPYSQEERDLIEPEIRKFFKTNAYKALSGLKVSERVATTLLQAKGLAFDKLIETTEQRIRTEIEAKGRIEDLSAQPKKKPGKPETEKQKETAKLIEAANAGDRRAQQKLAGQNDPVLEAMIKRSGG